MAQYAPSGEIHRIGMDKMKPFEKKIWLSSPTMHGDEQKWVNDAFEKNWITTAGESEIL